TEYLYQNNMKISIPFLMSTDNYGILIDTESSLVFESKDTLMTFLIYAEEQLSYYVILGDDFDEIIYHLRELTGRASMLPRWAFGYMQSKEKYSSQKELLE
ncbi:glycoside hydrolase, partial [Romboutsia ilealis]|nr:glycoside hydrolase [Romboutsia ilealis]